MVYEFDIMSVENKVNDIGQQTVVYELVATFIYPNGVKTRYQFTAKRVGDFVMHDMNKIQKDIPDSQLRKSFVDAMKRFVKSL